MKMEKRQKAEYEINDRAVMEAMPFVKIEKIKSEVEKREALKKTCENDKLDEDMKKKQMRMRQ